MRPERGFTTIQYVVATGLSLLLFVLTANVLVDLYARGAVRDGLDEGVHAAVPAGASVQQCVARTREVVASIAGGSVLQVRSLRCSRDGDRVVARAAFTLRSWLPMVVPDWHVQLQATATIER